MSIFKAYPWKIKKLFISLIMSHIRKAVQLHFHNSHVNLWMSVSIHDKGIFIFKTKGHDFLMFISKASDGWEHANQMTNQKEHRCLLFWLGEGN